MPASSGQQSRKRPPRSAESHKTIKRWTWKMVEEENSDQSTEGGQFSNLSHCEVLAGALDMIAKASHHRNVSQKRSEFKKTVESEISELVRFGPFYGFDTDANQRAKDKAWDHIVESDQEAESSYKSAVNSIEDSELNSYDTHVADELKPSPQFKKMMERDGCFFLQLALHILGGQDLLGYPLSNPYFGRKADSTSRIPDMFFAGNQIPYSVIRALMKQKFFKNVIQKGIKSRTWQPPEENNYAKLILYMTVVEPELERPSFFSKLVRKPMPHFDEPPSNILEGLHMLFLGTRYHDPNYSQIKDFLDLEAGSKGDDIKISTAGELYKSGIKLRNSKKPGIRNIRFKNFGYCAKLYLPTLKIDTHTKQLLTSLLNYEQSMNQSDREVTAYLRFMRDLAPTYQDFKILEDNKIIIVDEEFKDSTVLMLDDLVTIHRSNLTLNFRQIRQKINDYGGPPWRLISFFLGFFTIIQTIFTVLSYIFPPK